MKKSLLFTLINFCFYFLIMGQSSTRLVTITQGSPTNTSGLGYSFTGEVLSDNILYFRGSGNGSQEAIWTTDGTIQGTKKLIEDESIFGSDWDHLRFTEDEIIINENNTYKVLFPGQSVLKNIPNFPMLSLVDHSKAENGTNYFLLKENGNLVLASASSNFSTASNLGILAPSKFNPYFNAGNGFAIYFNDNSFDDQNPKIYLESLNQILDIKTYIESLSLTFSQFIFAYAYGDFLFINYKDGDNFFKNKVINVGTKDVYNYESINAPIHVFKYKNDIVSLTKRDVIKFSPSLGTATNLYNNVYSFSPYKVNDNKLYFVKGNNNNLVELNLDNGISNELINSGIGNSNYNSKIEVFNNNLYYISSTPSQLLNKYNFTTNSPEIVDTLSIYTGAAITHALKSFNGKLLISKRIGQIQHELFIYEEGISSIKDKIVNTLKVVPSLANEEIYITGTDESLNSLTLYNNSGIPVTAKLLENKINISHLPQGNYTGVVQSDKNIYHIKFIKI